MRTVLNRKAAEAWLNSHGNESVVYWQAGKGSTNYLKDRHGKIMARGEYAACDDLLVKFIETRFYNELFKVYKKVEWKNQPGKSYWACKCIGMTRDKTTDGIRWGIDARGMAPVERLFNILGFTLKTVMVENGRNIYMLTVIDEKDQKWINNNIKRLMGE